MAKCVIITLLKLLISFPEMILHSVIVKSNWGFTGKKKKKKTSYFIQQKEEDKVILKQPFYSAIQSFYKSN